MGENIRILKGTELGFPRKRTMNDRGGELTRVLVV